MNDFILDSRLKLILLYLANASSVVTIQQIADEIGVSRRTVLRDLQEVEKWLKSNGFELHRKSGKGIKLGSNESDRRRLIKLLNDKVPEVINIPKDRQKMLLVELLQMKEPVKLYYFSSKFGVSISTLSNDLVKVEEWLKKYNLSIARKTGLGVYVSGDEKNFRRAMISLLYENLSEEELMMIIKNTVTGIQAKENTSQINVRNRLLNLIDKNSIEIIESTISNVEKTLPYKMVESARIGLMVHLALAIQRIKNKEKINIDLNTLEQLTKAPEYSAAKKIAKAVSKEFNIDIPEGEIGYITMHLNGARIYDKTTRDLSPSKNKDIFDIANEMVSIAEKEFKVNFAEKEKLVYDLVCHLDPAIRRLQMNMDIRNPLLKKLQQLFPEAYKISERVSDVLREKVGIEIPDSEVGFLAMHFGAAIEKNKLETKRNIRIIVACPSGIGSSRFLSARLEKEFNDFEIVDVVSTSDISPDYIVNNKIDYVISTIPIQNCAVKNICVNPLLLEDDKILIKQHIYGFEKKEKDRREMALSVTQVKDNILEIANYSKFFIDILKNNFYLFNDTVTDYKKIISEITDLISEDNIVKIGIEEKLVKKEDVVINNNCIVYNCYIKELEESNLILCKLNKQMIKKYFGASLEFLLILVMPEKIKLTHKSIIKEFNTYLSASGLFVKNISTESTNDLAKRFDLLISSLYLDKLDEWRTGMMEPTRALAINN
ncbi:MAG: BglG family transcription antiterminator [Acetivibrionales bacterium]